MVNLAVPRGTHVPMHAHRSGSILLWCHHGQATLTFVTPDGVEHRELDPGESALVPAGVGHRLDVHPGGLVIPVGIPDDALTASPGGPSFRSLNTSWNNWILHHFVSTFTYLFSVSEQPRDVVRRLRTADPVVEDRSPGNTPPFPTSEPLRAIVTELLTDPTADRTADEWAARYGLTLRTLHRRFLAETGMSLVRWRRESRILAAEDFLRAGYRVSWVSDAVGFQSPGGLIRAFRKKHGMSPTAWREGQSSVPTSARVRRSLEKDALADALRGQDRPAPAIPASFARSADHPENLTHHILMYVHRGSVELILDETSPRRITLHAGDAVWEPAGIWRVISADPGSVAIPLRFHVSEIPDPLREVTVVKVPPGLREMMLHHAVRNLSLIQPENYDRLSVLEIFGDAMTRRRENTVTLPEDPAARAVATALARDLRNDLSLQDWAVETGSDPRTINRAFLDATGRNFRSWRATLRLRAAHDLMAAGVSPSAAARRVGYKHLSGFSRDFSRHYGMTPREFMGE